MTYKAKRILAITLCAISISLVLTVLPTPFTEVVSRIIFKTENYSASAQAASPAQQTVASSRLLLRSTGAEPLQETFAQSEVMTPEELSILKQQIEVAKEYEAFYQEWVDRGIGMATDVRGASLVRMDYEIDLLLAEGSLGEAVALREQQIEVAKEYEELQRLFVETFEATEISRSAPASARDAALTRLYYEMKLIEEKKALKMAS